MPSTRENEREESAEPGEKLVLQAALACFLLILGAGILSWIASWW
jgi:hypothetical protein